MESKKGHTRGRAIALYSGGLDSALAILLIQKQNIKVTALTFVTDFGGDASDSSRRGFDHYLAAEKFGFEVKLIHLGQKFTDIVKSPRHGYGKNMNPCIDCRILMLHEARLFMETISADFVITGEVIGQRPKSQHRPTLRLVEKESGLEGLLVRPLSARLLPETIPERNGLIGRNLLEGISGRSRKRQLELAGEFGLEDFSNPAGGCLLTDANYSKRLKDLLAHVPDPDRADITLLRYGRHFRLDNETKLIVGRDETDNDHLRKQVRPEYLVLEALGVGSPVALCIGSHSPENIGVAAAITARYSDARNEFEVVITCLAGDRQWEVIVRPAAGSETDRHQVK
jgi:tRNA-specific 2-thiouridylase